MRDPQQRPLLAKWPFYLSNILLVLVAIVLAFQARDKLSASHIFWCIFSVLAGSVLFIYPFYQEFKAHVSLQKSKNAGLSKDQIQRLDHTLYQMQEMKEGILQHNHKQSLDQNLISSTLQSIEERFNTLIEKAIAVHKASEDDLSAFERLEAKLQDIFEKLQAQQAIVLKTSQADLPKQPSLQAPIPFESGPALDEPLPAFFRNTVGPSSDNRPAADLSTLNETFHTLYPSLEESSSPESGRRNLFAGDSAYSSAPAESPFSFDLDNLVTQNILSNQDGDLDLSPEDSSAYSQVQILDEMSPSSHDAKPLDLENALEEPTFTPLLEPSLASEMSYNPAQGTSLVVHANLGIGKKPYIRGQGPGLNWIYGSPMSFIEVGKWQWTAPDSSQPIICRIYKNDEIPADGEVLCLQPGEQVELSPIFKT